uniref:Uncharacterized protein n=1 Tax=Helianthus annuus TaxID=4232 RepID=A0A251SL14_HELAN
MFLSRSALSLSHICRYGGGAGLLVRDDERSLDERDDVLDFLDFLGFDDDV